MLDALHAATSLRARWVTAGRKPDHVERAATERFIQILSEASRHILPEVTAEYPQIDWRRLADVGNVLRHGYHKVDLSIIERMLEDDAPKLIAAVEHADTKHKRPSDPWPDPQAD